MVDAAEVAEEATSEPVGYVVVNEEGELRLKKMQPWTSQEPWEPEVLACLPGLSRLGYGSERVADACRAVAREAHPLEQ